LTKKKSERILDNTGNFASEVEEKKMAEKRPADVLREGERIGWSEFVSRLKVQLGIDVSHYGIKIFNDTALKMEPEVIENGNHQVWVSLRGGSS
jgi:hypothetical protein